MPPSLAEQLQELIDYYRPRLASVANPADTRKPGGWSPKEELGHLLDSATNNRVRFARAAIDGRYEGPTYKQNEWVDLGAYASMDWSELVTLWTLTNQSLVRLVKNIPANRLAAVCRVGVNPPMSLGALIEDYEVHMRYHLERITA